MLDKKSKLCVICVIFKKIFHFVIFVTTFAPFINIMIVITKAGGNRPDESLATSNFERCYILFRFYRKQITFELLSNFRDNKLT